MNKYLLIEAAFCRPTERTPVWFMRQAGRYLPEYRAVRDKSQGFLDMCFTPETAIEISMQPYRILGVDGVIMFSDILTPLIGMGIDLEFSPGPRINNPVSDTQDIAALKIPNPEVDTAYVGKILSGLRQELAGKVPVIGFAGSPATVAAYMVKVSDGHSALELKKLMLNNPADYAALMGKLTKMTINYLNYQIESGAEMIQLFDTWAGEFSEGMYREFILPYVQQVFDGLNRRGEVPCSYFLKGTTHLLEAAAESGADMLSIDWQTDLAQARQRLSAIGKKLALQGNLDPAILFAEQNQVRKRVREIMKQAKGQPGFIFNLGHGVMQHTPVENVRLVVEEVRSFT